MNAYEYLNSNTFADEEVVAGDPAVEVRIRILFERQLDVAADREAADVTRAAIGRFHEAGPAAGHDRKAEALPRAGRPPARSA